VEPPTPATNSTSTTTAPKESTTKVAIWCFVMILSCVPMTLSSVYKEKSLGEQEIDVVYLNGWVAVFQFLISIPLAIPSAYASDLTLSELPRNFIDGARCYVGIDSIASDLCASSHSPIYVNLYIAFNVVYNVLIILILKYGSSNLLWLAMTLMVPLGNFAFSLKFVPGHVNLNVEDYAGLAVIMIGLVIYRFVGMFLTWRKGRKQVN